MKAEELERGRKLADDSLAWHRSTMPFPDQYTEEAIPRLIKWLKQFAFPELEKTSAFKAFLVNEIKALKARKIVDEIAADNLRDHTAGPQVRTGKK